MSTITLSSLSKYFLAMVLISTLVSVLPVLAQDVPVEVVASVVEAPVPVLAPPAPVQAPVSTGLVRKIIDLISNMLVPALWVAFGPVAVKMITMTVNSWTKAYVPRGLQVPLATICGALFAGVTGDSMGVDPAMAVSIGGGAGLIAQILASINPDAMNASAPVKKVGT